MIDLNVVYKGDILFLSLPLSLNCLDKCLTHPFLLQEKKHWVVSHDIQQQSKSSPSEATQTEVKLYTVMLDDFDKTTGKVSF